jgi:Domain of unknown function (DUF4372)/Transposase DDE domain
MHEGKLVFAQLMDHLPMHTFRRIVARLDGDKSVKCFSCQDQFRAMAFAQLTWRDSLRDTVIGLNAQAHKLYHMGFRSAVARSTLADANEVRDWRIYEAFAQSLIAQARKLYTDEPFGAELAGTAYALDTTTIELCLSLFPWAHYQPTKGAIRVHTQMDLRGNIPTFLHIDDGKSYDSDILDLLVPEPGAIYVMDRGYVDFERLGRLNRAAAFFVIRPTKNLKWQRRASRPVDKAAGVQCDQSIAMCMPRTRARYPEALRRVRYLDPESGRHLVFFTNNFVLPARTIADLYRCRWQIELFFRWIKQNLRIKSFFGTSENSVRTQIWIAVTVYVLVAILKKRLGLSASLYTILQTLSLTMCEKMPLDQLLKNPALSIDDMAEANQLILPLN